MSDSAIEKKYTSLGGPSGTLGFPLSSENPCADGAGAWRNFTNGSIYSHPGHGVREVRGAILEAWTRAGREKGELGYPVADEADWTVHNLLEMLPPEFSEWQHPEFDLCSWLATQVRRGPRTRLGRWLKFQHGCITWWEDPTPPKGPSAWLWTGMGPLYKLIVPETSPASRDSVAPVQIQPVKEKPTSPAHPEEPQATEAAPDEPIPAVLQNPAAELVAQSECRLLREIAELREEMSSLAAKAPEVEAEPAVESDHFHAVQDNLNAVHENLGTVQNNLNTMQGEMASLRATTAKLEQELCDALLSRTVHDDALARRTKRFKVMAYSTLVLALAAVIALLLR